MCLFQNCSYICTVRLMFWSDTTDISTVRVAACIVLLLLLLVAGFLTPWLTRHVGPLRTQGVGASENWWIPRKETPILTVVSRNFNSKTSKVWDCFLETARRGDYKKNLLRLPLVLLAIYSSICWEKFCYCSFFFFPPINKNPLRGYSELRSIFGINLQLQTQNVHRAKFKRYISFHVVVLEHAPFLSCYTRKSRGARLLAATCWV